MKQLLILSLWTISFFIVCLQSTAQKTGSKNKKNDSNKQEIPPPPPPKKSPPNVIIDPVKENEIPPELESIKEVRIDITHSDTTWSDSASTLYKFPELDTIPPPDDELTRELQKMLQITGAINLGAQFAKSITDLKDQEDAILPKEFYERLYDELANGESRKLFEHAIIKVYRRHLTINDVKELNAFYETNVGKKYISLLTVFLSESQAAGENIGRYIGMKIYLTLLEEGKIK